MSRKGENRKWYGQKPKKVDGQIATRVEFYKTELMKIIKGIFNVTMSDEWELDYILNYLITRGFIIISDTPAGVIPIKGTLSGYNYWNYPTKAVCSAPILETFERTIGVDCQIVFLERTRYNSYYNFNNMLDIYAYKLAAADAGIDVNLFNSRAAYIAEAESKAQAESIKALYDRISEGDPLVVYKTNDMNRTGLNVAFNNLKQNFIADLIQDSKRTIMNEFLTLLGINNANTDKKERLVTNEVEANNVELACNVSLWRENLKLCIKRVKKIFPDIEFNIELRFDPVKQVLQSSTVEQEGVGYDVSGYNRNVGTKQS